MKTKTVLQSITVTVGLLVFTICFSGCQPFKAYSGPRLSRDKIAIVDGGSFKNGVWITKVDGVRTSPFDQTNIDRVELLPGLHTLEFTPGDTVRFFLANEHGTPISKTFNVESGKTYRVLMVRFDLTTQHLPGAEVTSGKWNVEISEK